MFTDKAQIDFLKARRRAFWQKIRSWFSGKSNTLLPFDQVRDAVPVKGQRYRGLQSIPIDQIVGSMGRYHEFNRAFLPTQDHTESRWVSIGKARYQQVNLPPIEVNKLGDVYFVKDGNHRVSVARQHGLDFIDAYVTEIDIPVHLTKETDITDLETIRETSQFLEQTGLKQMFPEADIRLTLAGEVDRLFEHIETHRYYLGLERGEEASREGAVRSWFESVYLPLVEEIKRQGLKEHFSGLTETDLYLLVSEYQGILREAYKDAESQAAAESRFMATLEKISREAEAPGKRIARSLKQARWLDDYILELERADFIDATGLDLRVTAPGAYATLLQHIRDHQWFLGIHQAREVPWEEAVASWYEQVYLTLKVIIEDLDILSYTENRTITDLYMWIITHHNRVSETLDWELPLETAAENLLERAKESADDLPPPEDTGRSRGRDSTRLFGDILVPFGDDDPSLRALEQALVIAKRNQGRIHGLHVIDENDEVDNQAHEALVERFDARCREHGVQGKAALDCGRIARVIADRAAWVDLIVLPLNHPPAGSGLGKIRSGIRYLLRRSGRPVLAVPGEPTPLDNILLAYDGSALADEALFLATVLLNFWEDTHLTVLTSGSRSRSSDGLLSRARVFLDNHQVNASYIHSPAPAGSAILENAGDTGANLIVMGGYGAGPAVELAFGSTIDEVLQGSEIPVLVRT